MISTSAIKQQMQKTIDTFSDDLRTLRPGRASAELIATLPIESYGGRMPLQQLSSITTNEQGQLLVQVWDKGLLGAAEKAIRDSQLGLSVINDGMYLRLTLPPMSQERRLELVKLVHQKAEAARVQLRQFRGDAYQQANREKTAGDIREDELARTVKELNKMIEDFNNEVKQIADQKEKELLSA